MKVYNFKDFKHTFLDIHDTRAHAGQSLSAARMRHLVHVQYEDDPDAGKYPSVIVGECEY